MKYIDLPQLSDLARVLTHGSGECTVHTRMEAYTTKPFNKDKRLWKTLEHNYEEEQAFVNSQFSTSPPKSSPVSPLASGESQSSNRHSPELIKAMEGLPGPLDKRERKTLYILKATLNAAFPDHDFSSLRAEHFTKEKDCRSVLGSLSATLSSVEDTTRVDPTLAYQPRSFGSYPSRSRDIFPSSVPTSSSPVDLFGELERNQRRSGVGVGAHPALFRIMDDVIGLEESDVYSYTPDADADPHGSLSDDEDESSDSEELDDDSSGSEAEDLVNKPRRKKTHSWGWYNDDSSSDGSSDEEEKHPNEDNGLGMRRSRGIAIPTHGTQGRRGAYGYSGDYASSSAGGRGRAGGARTIGTTTAGSSPNSWRRTRGALLWSSHYFFINRKLKRVLFISIWARRRRRGWTAERFVAWPGAVGAGQRAFGSLAGTIE